MALLDIVILVMVCGGGFMGWHKRFTGQLGSIGGVLLGMVLCRLFAPDIAAHFNQPDDTVQTRLLHTVLVYVLIGAVGYFGVRVVVHLTRSVLRTLHMGAVDRIAGAVFSVFQWLLGLSVILNVWLAIFPDSELRTANRGAVDAVLTLAPTVFGSETAKSILNSGNTGSADTANETVNGETAL